MSKQQAKTKNYKLPKGFVAGVKRTRGQPVLHEERKVQLNLTVSPTAREYLRAAAQVQGLSISELVEQWARTILSQGSECVGTVMDNPLNDQEPDYEEVRMQQEREELQSLSALQQIKALADDWNLRVHNASLESSKGKPSPRYAKAIELLKELRKLL